MFSSGESIVNINLNKEGNLGSGNEADDTKENQHVSQKSKRADVLACTVENNQISEKHTTQEQEQNESLMSGDARSKQTNFVVANENGVNCNNRASCAQNDSSDGHLANSSHVKNCLKRLEKCSISNFDSREIEEDSSEKDDSGYDSKLNISCSDAEPRMWRKRKSSSKRNISFDESSEELGAHVISFDSELGDVPEDASPDKVKCHVTFDEFYQYYRDRAILSELDIVKNEDHDGVYVIPSFHSLQIWHGVMFIRDGPYHEGIFHFNIYLTDDFPESRPVLRFSSKIFHPQISARTGTLNLSSEFPKWRHQKNRISSVLKFARSCFYHLDTREALNIEAAELVDSDFEKFKARCRSSVLDSLLEYEERRFNKSARIDDTTDPKVTNPFKAPILDEEMFCMVKNVMVNQDLDSLYGSYSMLTWAKSQLGKVLNNLSYTAKNEETNDSLDETS